MSVQDQLYTHLNVNMEEVRKIESESTKMVLKLANKVIALPNETLSSL